MRRLLATSVIVLAAMLTLSALAMRVGAAIYEPPSALAGFGTCDGQPCWHGIIPGLTPFENVDGIMRGLGYEQALVTYATRDIFSVRYTKPAREAGDCDVEIANNEGVVSAIQFVQCSDIRLGDTMLAVGIPSHVGSGPLTFSLDGFFAFPSQIYSARYDNNCPNIARAYADIDTISLQGGFPQPFKRFPTWHGFMPYWVYSQRYGLTDCSIFNTLY
jgi:hypothetical protein